MRGQGVEHDDFIQTVPELGAEEFFNGPQAFVRCNFGAAAPETDAGGCHLARAGIGGHQKNYMPEIGLFAVIVGERCIVHDLQQNVENIRMCFFNFIQQHYAEGMSVDGISQQAGLLKTDISGRSPDQAGDRVLFHVFAHVKTHKLNAHHGGKLSGDFGFADTGRSHKHKRPDGLVWMAKSCARALNGGCEAGNGAILAEHPLTQGLFKILYLHFIRA